MMFLSSALRLQPAALRRAAQRAMEQPWGPRAPFISIPDPGEKRKKRSDLTLETRVAMENAHLRMIYLEKMGILFHKL